MKKYFFGLFAIVMAIGFSAFTTRPAQKTVSDSGYYFIVDDNGYVVSGGVLGYTTREDAVIAGGCDGTATLDCMRGYTSDPGYHESDLTSSSAPFKIKKESF